MSENSRYLVNPVYDKVTIDLNDPWVKQRPVFPKNGKKLPVTNRRTRRAFNKATHPRVVVFRQIKRQANACFQSLVQTTALRLYAESAAQASYMLDNGTMDGYVDADVRK